MRFSFRFVPTQRADTSRVPCLSQKPPYSLFVLLPKDNASCRLCTNLLYTNMSVGRTWAPFQWVVRIVSTNRVLGFVTAVNWSTLSWPQSVYTLFRSSGAWRGYKHFFVVLMNCHTLYVLFAVLDHLSNKPDDMFVSCILPIVVEKWVRIRKTGSQNTFPDHIDLLQGFTVGLLLMQLVYWHTKIHYRHKI